MRGRGVLLLIAVMVVGTLCCPLAALRTAFEPTPSPTLAPTPSPTLSASAAEDAQARHRRIFERVWSLVEQNYVYADYNGVDWEAVREEFAPLVEAAPDDASFWALMAEMVSRLDDGHSVYLTPDEVADEEEVERGMLDYVGIGVYLTIPAGARYAVLLLVFPDSPAEAAGLRPHDRILAVEGERVCCNIDGSNNLDLLLGEVGTTVRVTVRSPNAPPREVTVRRDRIRTALPILQRRIATHRGDVGYLLIPSLRDRMMAERVREALEPMLTTDPVVGLVVDMRINGGGGYDELYDLLSLFLSGKVGWFQRRGDDREVLDIRADPIGVSRDVPLVVLVGPYTESYAEVFSGVLQARRRAVLVGLPTAGNVETILPYDFDDGSRLWLAEETFVPLSGERWEGRGVYPDVWVDAYWEQFTDEDDPQLKAALRVLVGE